MGRFFLFFIFFLSLNCLSQQVVEWDVSQDSKSNEIHIIAKIKEGWHLYSQHIDNNVGPVPTSFTFKSSDNFQLIGRVKEPMAIKKYDENFEATLDFFEHEVVFLQNVKVLNDCFLEGTITFMVCNETMCLPPVDHKFKIELKK
jgi:thiol:disulfide interchange protein DsbD